MKQEYDFGNGKRGAIDTVPGGMTRITLCLDDSVIDWFRTRVEMNPGYYAGSYQGRINEVLRLQMYKEILILSDKKLKDDRGD